MFWHAAVAGQVKLLATEGLIEELRDVLTRHKLAKQIQAKGKSIEQIIHDHRLIVEIVKPAVLETQVSADPDDDEVIACAVGGGADCIVSGDNHLLSLGAYQAIPIYDVNHFLSVLDDTQRSAANEL